MLVIHCAGIIHQECTWFIFASFYHDSTARGTLPLRLLHVNFGYHILPNYFFELRTFRSPMRMEKSPRNGFNLVFLILFSIN